MITQYFVLLDQHLADKSHWQGRHPICNLKQFHIVFANVTDGWFFLSFVRFWLIRAHLTCPKQYGVVVRIRCKPPQRVIIGLSNWSIRRWWWWGGGWWWCIAMSGLTFVDAFRTAGLAIELAEGGPKTGFPSHKLDRPCWHSWWRWRGRWWRWRWGTSRLMWLSPLTSELQRQRLLAGPPWIFTDQLSINNWNICLPWNCHI